MIFQFKAFSVKDGCWISQHQDSEGHLKELIPYSSVPRNQHFTSSSWAKLQTAGGLLEHFKTFLSRYFMAFLKINTHAIHSPFCRHSECVSQGPFFSWWVSYSSKQNLCSDFSTAVRLNFISSPPQPASPSLPGEQVPLYIIKEVRVIPAQSCYHCAHTPSRSRAPWQSILAQQGTDRGVLKGEWKNLITLCMRDLFQTLMWGLPRGPKS